MKKILVVLLSVLCLFTAVAAEEPAKDTKGTEVYYSSKARGGYEWTVPAKIDFTNITIGSQQSVDTNSAQLQVSVIKCFLGDKEYINIRIGDEEDVNDFILVYGNDDIPYELSKDSSNWFVLKNADLMLRAFAGMPAKEDGTLVTPVVQKFFGKMKAIPAYSGEYKDLVTFVANADAVPTYDLTGATWSGAETVNMRDYVDNLQPGRAKNMELAVKYNGSEYNKVEFKQNAANKYWINYKGSPDVSVYSSLNGVQEWHGDKDLKIKGGADIENLDVIAWLHENGTLAPRPELPETITTLEGLKWTPNVNVSNDTLRSAIINDLIRIGVLESEDVSSLLGGWYLNAEEWDVTGNFYKADGTLLASEDTKLFSEAHINDGVVDCVGMQFGAADNIFMSDREKPFEYSTIGDSTYSYMTFTAGEDLTDPSLIAILSQIGTFDFAD